MKRRDFLLWAGAAPVVLLAGPTHALASQGAGKGSGSKSPAAKSPTVKKDLDVPYVPTTDEAVRAMLKLAGVSGKDVVYDLGCGDGRIVIEAAKQYGARGVGIDIDPKRIAEANENARKAGVQKKVRFQVADLFDADIHEATVVTLFLLTSVNLKLRPKLLADLKPGTRVVSNTFDMGDWIPEQTFVLDENESDSHYLSLKFFLWRVPGKK